MAKRKNPAYDVTEAQIAQSGFAPSVDSYESLAAWLSQELDLALSMRGALADDIAYRWTYYEQGRTRKNAPWPDAADLTSPYATEFVDAILGRIMDTVMVDPVWIVEGWGESAKKAPFVEEFHQRAQEQERLQGYLRECFLRALIEPAGILEVSEGIDWQPVRKSLKAKIHTNDLGGPVLDEKTQPIPVMDQAGQFVEAGDNEPSASITVDEYQPVRLGPSYDVVPYLDYVRFPIHARAKSEIWGYAKRFWRRVPELQTKAKRGLYDAQAVEQLQGSDERRTYQSGVEPPPLNVVSQDGPTAQKELWEFSFLADLDGAGARWWIATLSRQHTQLLRLQVDSRTSRFIEFVPFPKPGSRDGYSLVEKMLTLLEEDTAVRNLQADRTALASAPVILRQSGSLWDPYEQPIGPGQVVDVRDPRELTQWQYTDTPPSLQVWRQNVRADIERGVGLNDVSVGTQTQERRTLGEVRLAAGYSNVRVKTIISAIQESLEELGQARHAIWVKTLEGMPQGIPAPQSFMTGLDVRGIEMQTLQSTGRITADMLSGMFWFKPRGSVETADLEAQGQLFMEVLKLMQPLIQLNPNLKAIFTTEEASRALVEQMLRVTRWPDKQAFLGSEAKRALGAVFQQQAQQAQQDALMQHPMMQMIQAMADHGGQPGLPPGAPQGQPAPQQPGMVSA